MFVKLFKVLLKTIFYIVAFAGLWLAAALLLPKIKIKADTVKVQKEVTIYVRTNGMHTDIVMPKQVNLANAVVSYNWNNLISDSLFKDVDSTYKYLAIGWAIKVFTCIHPNGRT